MTVAGSSTLTELSMTPDELTQFTALAKKYEKGKDKDAVLKVLQDDIHEVFQEVNDGGRAAANTTHKAKLDKVEADLQVEKTAREKAERELKDLEGKAPDAAKLKEKYDAEVLRLQTEHKTQLEVAKGETLQERLNTARESLRAKLKDKKSGIRPEYAETILLNGDEVKGRLKPGPDGKVGVLKKGSQDVFLVGESLDKVLDVFVGELREVTPKDWQSSGVTERGSNTGGSEGGPASTANRFDSIRQEEEQRNKSAKEAKTALSGLERLGRRRG